MICAALVLREIADESYGPHRLGESDDDVMENLGEEIAVLAAQIHSATHRLLTLIAEFDRLRGWERAGYPDCAHWLSVRTGVDVHTAREKVRAARALAGLPAISAAMARGQLSFSKVRALTRVATPENEEALLPLASGATTALLERMVRAWRKGGRREEVERERHGDRTLSIFPDDDGMYLIRGTLTPEVGALLMRAVEAAGDALFREDTTPGCCKDSQRQAAQRRADAIGLLAERALSAGFGPDAPVSGSGAGRYQVVLHVDGSTLEEEGEPGRSDLDDGTRVPAETSRRISCDAGLVRVAQSADGTVLDVGRKARTVPPAIRGGTRSP